jgi:hypothetical protein
MYVYVCMCVCCMLYVGSVLSIYAHAAGVLSFQECGLMRVLCAMCVPSSDAVSVPSSDAVSVPSSEAASVPSSICFGATRQS